VPGGDQPLAHYLVDIGPQRLHFLRSPARVEGPTSLPLVITHGWPGSIVEFLHIIDASAHPENHGGDRLDAFHVIAPSLPGYGFLRPADPREWQHRPRSDRAPSPACGTGWVHDKLNYRRPYGVQGRRLGRRGVVMGRLRSIP